jgi:type I restriction enzyme, S subunit
LRKPLSSMDRAKRNGLYPYYGAAKIIDYIDDYIFDGTYLLIAEDGSVITNEQKPVLQYVEGKFWANNHVHILKGKGIISTEHLYLALSEVNISGYITGAAQPKISQANLNRIPFLVPKQSLVEFFNIIVCDIFKQKMIINKKNQVLQQTRDLLLSKLISGEMDVSDLDIALPEEVSA